MFDTFPVIRLSQSVALLLVVALLASAGCRCLSSRFATTTPSVAPETTVPISSPPIDEPDRYSAFRPIMPEQFTQPMLAPVQTIPTQPVPIQEHKSEVPKFESKPDTATQSKIDELNWKITELESQLAEARKPPLPVVSDDLTIPETLPTKKKEIARVKNLPVINRQGVTVYEDDLQRVRIEVMDKVLFMPNTWQLAAEGEETLRTIAAEIRAFDPKMDLDIEGHTDSLMSDPNNQMQKHDISSVKAMAVMDFFVNTLRWDVARIGTSSFGRSRPIADNGTPEGRARNNRIELVLRSRGE